MKKENKILRKLEAFKLDFFADDSYSGEIAIDQHRYRFNVAVTNPGTSEYLVRGNVSLIDIDGHILQLTGSARKELEAALNEKGKTLSKHDARSAVKRSVYCRSTDPDEVRQQILSAINYLENKYGSQIRINTARERDVGSMNLQELIYAYHEKYLIKKGSKKSQTELLRKLKKIAGLIREPLDGITAEKVKKVASANNLTRDYLLATASFVDYLFAEHGTIGKNAFREYLKMNVAKKNVKKLQSDAVTSNVLSFDEEQTLNDLIEKSIATNPLMAALLLIKDAGFQAQDAATITFGDISYDKECECMFIKWKNKDTTSAIQDYTFPVSPFCSRMLQLRMDAIKEENSQFADRHIVETASGLAVTGKEITDFCRRILRNTGNQYAIKANLRYLERENGVNVLRNTYKNRLQEHCGIRDINVIRFLAHESIGASVLACNYRSFTQRTGRRYLAMVLKVDRRFMGTIDTVPTKARKEDGKQINVFPAISNTEQTVTEFVYTPQSEEVIELSSKYGLTFRITVEC